jgi:chitodextrinase
MSPWTPHSLAPSSPNGGLTVRHGRTRRAPLALLALGALAVALLLSLSPRHVHAAGDPVIASAGDIACDPANSNFNGGNGQNGACQQKATYTLLTQANPSAILVLGDNQYYCGGLAAFQQSYALSWGQLLGKTYPSPGNHEYLTSGGTGCNSSNAGAAGYFNYYAASAQEGTPGQGWHSFDLGNWHLIALNSNCGDAGGCGSTSPQGTWLANDLAAHKNECLLAYWHIPLYSSGGRAAANSQPFWQLLYSAHADVVLNGHDHIYERFAPQDPNGNLDTANGIREFIAGTGGANHTSVATVAANSLVRNASTFGVLELTLHPSSYDWTFVPVAGQTFTDSGSASCHNSSSSSDTTPPSVPTNLSATGVSSSQINLSWTASTDNIGVAGYHVFRDGGGTAIATVTSGTSYQDTGLAAGSTHSYTVSAFDAAGNESARSSSASATTSSSGGGGSIALVQQQTASGGAATLSVAPSPASRAGDALVAVVALAAGSSASVMSVSDSASGTWTKGPVGYLTGTNSRVEIWYELAAPAVTSVMVTLSAAKSAAVNLSEWAGVASASALDAAASGNAASSTSLATPSLSTTNASDLVLGAVNYPATASSTLTSPSFTSLANFESSTSVHGRAAYALTSGAGTYQATWTLSAPSGGNGSAILALKGAAAPTPDVTPPSTTIACNSAACSGSYSGPVQVTLSATDNAGGSGVQAIYYTTDGSDPTTSATRTQYTSAFTVSATTTVKFYSVDVAGNAESVQSTTISITSGGDTIPPTAPTNLAANAVSPTQINLSWTASTDNVGVTGYQVFRGGTQIATVSGSTTSYSNTGLQPSTTYSYTVNAVDAGGNVSGASNTATATTQADTTPPSSPTNLTARKIGNTNNPKISLKWGASTDNIGVAGYRVYRNGSLLASVSASTLGYNDSSPPQGTDSYYVVSFDAAGNPSDPSNTVSVSV